MGFTLLDISDKIVVTNTAYNSTRDYSLIADHGDYLLISQISINADTNFQTNGKLQIMFGGRAITHEGNNNSNEVGMSSSLTIDAKEKDFWALEPNQSLDVDFRVTTGTGTTQVFVSGTRLTREEYEQMRQKHFGVNR